MCGNASPPRIRQQAVCAAVAAVLVGAAFDVANAEPQRLNENCIVSVLNRNTRVRPDGTWVLPNIPANFGLVRARATCIFDGVTVSGESEPFLILANGSVNVPPIQLGETTPIPTSLQVSASPAELAQIAQTSQVSVLAHYSDGSSTNVTAGSTGTLYVISNPGIATITGNGVVTALSSGTALVQATHEGTSGFTSIRVVLSADTDHDGIADDLELSLGLNPNNAADALEDRDHDGLNNLGETVAGTSLDNPDSDGDGLLDGEEVRAGADAFITNPLLPDTDGDGVRDALEVASGSNPTDASSLNLGKALKAVSVTPETFAITINSVQGEGFRQLTVTGVLQDGNTIDLTSTARGTNYQSNDLNICNFGSPDGRVFGGNAGACTITVTNNGHTDTAQGSVSNFTPVPLSFVAIPGFANNVDVSGNYAYVAAGGAGLQIVSVSNRAAPVIVGAFDTPGNANDVVVVGNLAYVADGTSGLQIINVANPAAPGLVAALDTPGEAWDVVVRQNRAYIADGAAGLRIVDVSNPSAPQLLGSIDPAGTQKGVDVDPTRQLAVLASGTSGIHVIDVSDPSALVQRGALAGGDVRDVALKGNFAFLADYSRSFTSVDLTDPANPILGGSTPLNLGGRLHDVTVQGNFALGADVLFVNGVSVMSIEAPATPVARDILNFSSFRDDDGQGIASDGSFVYLAAALGSAFTENGVTGNSRLYIGQYLALEDRQGVAPTVSIVAPAANSTFVEGETIPVRVDANDDIAVVSVALSANGGGAGNDTSAPYEFNIVAPNGVTAVTLGATATDLGGNTGVASPVVVNVIPDPLTTVVGRVVDRNGVGVSGAAVTVSGRSGVSVGDGTFSIAAVPTTSPNISVSASVVVDGAVLRGSSAVVPVQRGGTTDVGQIVVVGGATYYAYVPFGAVKLLGWTNGTTYKITNLNNNTVLANATINRFQIVDVGMPNAVHIKVETSNPVFTSVGYDCCAFGGSFFYPAIDGEKQVGREFILRIPVLSGSNAFEIFAYEASTVTITNAAGTVITTQVIPAGGVWTTFGSPLAANTAYRVQSTGDIAIQSNSRNAFTAVPSRTGDDTGTSFMFGVYVWSSVGAAIFAYEDTTVTATNINTNAVAFTTKVSAGQFAYVSGFGGYNQFRLVSTGKISLWAGSTEGSASIEWLGDDPTVTTGDHGKNLFIHTQTQGGFLFASEDGTTVNINGSISVLNRDQFIDLKAGQFLHITADKPIVVETIGGNGLNDWEFALRIVPRP